MAFKDELPATAKLGRAQTLDGFTPGFQALVAGLDDQTLTEYGFLSGPNKPAIFQPAQSPEGSEGTEGGISPTDPNTSSTAFNGGLAQQPIFNPAGHPSGQGSTNGSFSGQPDAATGKTDSVVGLLGPVIGLASFLSNPIPSLVEGIARTAHEVSKVSDNPSSEKSQKAATERAIQRAVKQTFNFTNPFGLFGQNNGNFGLTGEAGVTGSNTPTKGNARGLTGNTTPSTYGYSGNAFGGNAQAAAAAAQAGISAFGGGFGGPAPGNSGVSGTGTGVAPGAGNPGPNRG